MRSPDSRRYQPQSSLRLREARNKARYRLFRPQGQATSPDSPEHPSKSSSRSREARIEIRYRPPSAQRVRRIPQSKPIVDPAPYVNTNHRTPRTSSKAYHQHHRRYSTYPNKRNKNRTSGPHKGPTINSVQGVVKEGMGNREDLTITTWI